MLQGGGGVGVFGKSLFFSNLRKTSSLLLPLPSLMFCPPPHKNKQQKEALVPLFPEQAAELPRGGSDLVT